MKDSSPTFFVLDGNALLHRAWHALPPLTTKDGRVVNAAYGFSMVLENMLEEFKPTYMAVAWDLPGKTFRHEQFEDYKAHREEKEQDLYDQIPIIQEILKAYGIPSLSVKGYEADDVIGTLSQIAKKKSMETYIVTGDLDALQLVNDHVSVVFFQKGISKTKIYTAKEVKDRYGLTPKELIDYKALRGDPSDNIPGIKGVGEKTATELVQSFGSIEGIFSALEKGEVEEKFAKKLREKEEVAKQSRVLVEIVCDVPLAFELKEAVVKTPDTEALLDMYRDLEFRSLVRKYEREAGVAAVSNVKTEGVTLLVGRKAKEIESGLKKLEGERLAVACVEQPADLFGETLGAVAVADEKTSIIIPNPSSEVLAKVEVVLKGVKSVVVHDLKQLMHITGWRPDHRYEDTLIYGYILNPGRRSHDIDVLAHEYLQVKLPSFPEALGTDKAYKTLGIITATLPRLAKVLEKNIMEAGMHEVLQKIEMPLIPVLHDMEKTGIALDVDALKAFSKKLQKRIEALTKEIHTAAGEEFNINSTQQLAKVLFENLKLPTKGIKKTKTGYSTAASELEKLQDEHEIVSKISEYREITKLQSTYVEALPNLVKKDGRIHTTFNQTVTSTGRLSSSNPNLQNIPIRTDLGNEIRKAFIASKGKVLIAADYSQIELRLAAVIAKDEPLMKAFQEGADIHTRTAAELFEVEKEENVTSKQRRAAKAINFAVLYGMGPRALAVSADISYKEAQEFIKRYFEIHKGIKEYVEQTKAFAHEMGYVETLFHRRRYFPEISSGVHQVVAAAERMAVNMPIQGTEADLMKLAMINVQDWLKHSNWPAQLLLQVHDELVIEVAKEAQDAVARGIKEIMESVAIYEVPLTVEVEIGKNWGEMKPWNVKE